MVVSNTGDVAEGLLLPKMRLTICSYGGAPSLSVVTMPGLPLILKVKQNIKNVNLYASDRMGICLDKENEILQNKQMPMNE